MTRKTKWIRTVGALSAAFLFLAPQVLFSLQASAAVVSYEAGPGSTASTGTGKQTTAGKTAKTLETAEAVVPNETYNKELGMYEQEFGNGRRMVTSIANGSQVADAVYIQVPDNALVRLELDGRVHAFQNTVLLTDPGYYVMLVSSTVVGSNTRADAVFRFRLLPPPAGRRNTEEYIWPKVKSSLSKTTYTSEGLTLFTMTNRAGFLTDVPGNNETVSQAAFYFPANMGYEITRDGAPVEYDNQEQLTLSGRYHVKVYAPSQAYEGDYAAFYEAGFDFVIPSNADDSLLAESAQPVSVSSSGSSSGSDSGNSNVGSELTYQSDMVTETWRQAARLYEERFSNGIVFFSNVSDNDIVGGGVYLDIPSNVGVKMKRDGDNVPFLNKELLNTEGTYLLTLTSNTNLGGDKNIYQSFFHFRIQSGLPMAGEGSAVITEETAEQTEVTLSEEEAALLQESEAAGQQEETTPALETEAEETTETVSQKNTNQMPELQDPPDGYGYEESLILYSYKFPDGTVFYVGAPQNGISNTPVSMQLPEGGKGKITMGGRSVDLPAAVQAEDDGSYHAEITSAGGDTISWDFRIMSHAVSNLSEVKAPEGYYIDSIVKNEELLADSQYASSYQILEDGTYTISFMPYFRGYPEWFYGMTRDTVPPVLTFEGLDENGKAVGKEVTFTASKDTMSYTLLKGKKQVKLNGTTISGGGDYTLTAVDAAGNEAVYTFQIPHRANLISLCVVLFILIVAMGFVTYYKVYGEKFKAR